MSELLAQRSVFRLQIPLAPIHAVLPFRFCRLDTSRSEPVSDGVNAYVFHTDHIRYYLHHIEEKRPDLLQEIMDKGEIYKHLDELDTKVTNAVNRQTELLMQSSRDYQAAVMSGRIDQSGAIGNLLRMQAQRAVFDTMIYLWRDE